MAKARKQSGQAKRKAAAKAGSAKAKKKTAARKKPDSFARLVTYALRFPEATEEHPWGETAIKVRGKIFVFLGSAGLTVKLPRSKEFALEYPFTRPSPYGLGRSGWVSAKFAAGEKLPLDLLKDWIGESYRTIAPRKLSAGLDRAR